jgi:hypothetical protein
MDNDSYSRKYYVIFKNTGVVTWFSRFMDPYFRHVLVVTKSDYGHFLIVTDSKGGNISTEMESLMPIRELYPDDVILEFNSIVHEKIELIPCIPTCVSFVKAILGIRKWGIFTPYQLYKHILRSI